MEDQISFKRIKVGKSILMNICLKISNELLIESFPKIVVVG